MGTFDQEPVTSPSLLIRIRDSADSDSWDTFEETYAPVIRAFCRRRGFQASDIEDITQDVMVKIANSIKRFEYDPNTGKFRSWLATITANQLRLFIRRRQIHDEHLIKSVETFSRAPANDSEWTSVFFERVFEAACSRIRSDFEEKTWQCFEETWVKNVPPAVVAQSLDVAIHTVYVNKSRVLKRLEQEFEDLTDDLPLADA